MDIRQVLAELHKELARIDEAIQTMERLREGAPRRGRPPNWLAEAAKHTGEAPRKARKKRRSKDS